MLTAIETGDMTTVYTKLYDYLGKIAQYCGWMQLYNDVSAHCNSGTDCNPDSIVNHVKTHAF